MTERKCKMSKENLRIPAKGCNLNVTKVVNEGSNSVIVVLHGGPGSGAQPVMNLPAFQILEQTFSMVYFDQRGSGESEYDLTNELSVEQITDDVKCIVDYIKEEFKGKKVYLWGGSFGGLLGLLFLKKYPLAVDKAIISSPSILPSDEYTQRSMFHFLQEMSSNFLPDYLVNKIKALDTFGEDLSDIPGFSDWIKENKKPMEGYEGIWHAHAMRKWYMECDMRSSIKDIQIKTLFLMGMEDPFISAQVLIDAVEQYPNENVTLKTFSPCGHGVFDDCKDEFCKVCTDFYQEA